MRCACVAILSGLFALIAILTAPAAFAELVAVDHLEGGSHGFLTLTALDGTPLADGEVTQIADNDKVTGHLVFKFKDGSLYDDTAVYSQHGQFRLISDHRLERGPSFKHTIETSIDMRTGAVNVRYDGTGKEKIIATRRKLPEDLANGIFIMLLNHIPGKAQQTTVSFLATTPELHVVNLVMTRGTAETVHHGEIKTRIVPYVVHVKIPGLAGALAAVAGKQPRDMKIWVMDGTAPAFVRFEGALFLGGPMWRIEAKPEAASLKP
jgi:hypothetical protein